MKLSGESVVSVTIRRSEAVRRSRRGRVSGNGMRQSVAYPSRARALDCTVRARPEVSMARTIARTTLAALAAIVLGGGVGARPANAQAPVPRSAMRGQNATRPPQAARAVPEPAATHIALGRL